MSQIIIEKDIPCTLRDGVTLYANIYRPNQSGQFPTILSRLPYNKNLPNFSHRYIDPIRLVEQSYVVIIQDVRGRFASEGEFQPFNQEFNDGYDSVEWAASLHYSNGHVGLFGLSYYGFTQMFAAMSQPPSLKAIFPAFTGHNIAEEFSERQGAVELAKLQTWMLDSVASDYLKRKQTAEQFKLTEKQITNDLDHIFEWHRYTPYEEWPPIMEHEPIQQLYTNYINNELFSDALKHTDINAVQTPGFHMAGWYDCFLNATINNYTETVQNNSNQKLIIGPWGHGVFSPYFGDRYLGLHSSGDDIEGKDDVTSLHIKWFDYWLKGKSSNVIEEAPIKLFVMGSNKWRSEYEWPLARTNYTPLYLQKDNRLSFNKPSENKSYNQFKYDPNQPVPTKGGPSLFIHGINTGPLAQNEIETRDDVLIYTTEPLEQPVEVTGPVKAYVYASSDAVNTDFTVKLTDVQPDGTSINVTEGIVRSKHQHPNFKPDDFTLFVIDLWATSIEFLQGHRIRIQISSSNFPMYDVNPNTGNSLRNTTEATVANQTIYHNKDYPSHVLLPIIDS
ncbi:CocE/NonD family hydrolase [Alkalibacillus haloalkaliphilus]|uniref:CocE/NonD family hydrolase n=1 Tax=Alkalibacillus haloalkaliphilus TaxID=94136 RepID=UPI00293674E6|nr:CocE/NonD family hydrolase [Alkalibacillus haloalkaliphilus]MDV2581822.1 CocE/NonD family hydrolase [Alkalibacillus haloalkaliphilus]